MFVEDPVPVQRKSYCLPTWNKRRSCCTLPASCLHQPRPQCRQALKVKWDAHRCLRAACSHCVIAWQVRALPLLFSCKVGAPLWPEASFFPLFSALGHKGTSFFVESPSLSPVVHILLLCSSFVTHLFL